MRYLAAYALLALGGNAKPSVADVTAVITSVGGSVDAEKLNALHAKINGQDIAELITKGGKLLGNLGGASKPAAAAAAAPAAAAKKEEPKKVEEPKEEEFEGAGDLFDF